MTATDLSRADLSRADRARADHSPAPGAAPIGRMLRAQTALETSMLLRNGEQLLLTVVIPSVLLVLFSAVDIVSTTGPGPGSTSSRPACWRWR